MSRTHASPKVRQVLTSFRSFVAVPVLCGIAVLAGCAAGGLKGAGQATGANEDPASPDYGCTDTDGGLNPGVRGRVIFKKQQYNDRCEQIEYHWRVNEISADGGDHVLEYSCYDDKGSPLCSQNACRYTVLQCAPGETCYRGKCGPPSDNPDYWPGTVNCEDSDNGLNYYERGRVKYRSQTNRRLAHYQIDDKCISDTDLREGYCSNGSYSEESKRCEYACACGRCFSRGEKVDCRADFNQYCSSESCYVIQRDFDDIKFVSQNKERNNCFTADTCEAFVGRYKYDGGNITVRVELTADVDSSRLRHLVRKRHGSESGTVSSFEISGQQMKTVVAVEPQQQECREGLRKLCSNPVGEFCLVSCWLFSMNCMPGSWPYAEKKLENACAVNSQHWYWLSDKKVISVKMEKDQAGQKRAVNYLDFLKDYLRVHPSDIHERF